MNVSTLVILMIALQFVMFFFFMITLVTFGVILLERTKHNSLMFAHLDTMDMLVSNIHAIVSGGSDEITDISRDANTPIFRSLDGKYTASTLEELISKMQQDPSCNITPADTEKLREMFEGLLPDEDDDEPDDPDNKWKKGK